MKKMPQDYIYLKDMYEDSYYPTHLVDKIKDEIVRVVRYIEKENPSKSEIQARFDTMTEVINDLEEDFLDADSEIETVARDSIGQTVIDILENFGIDIDVETAIRKRDW